MRLMTHRKTTCFVAGRSGGHIIPALTLAQKEKQKNPATNVLFFSASSTLDKHIAGSSQMVNWHIPLKLGNVPIRKPWRLPIFFWRFFRSFFSALFWLKKKKVQKVVSTGGYISLPVCLAAWTLRIPIELFELNAEPGKATKFLAPFSKKISTCFEQTKQCFPSHKCCFVKYPIRYKQLNNTDLSAAKAREQINLDPNKKTILILGGSQGSIFINNLIKKWITNRKNKIKNIQIIHQTGAIDTTDWKKIYENLGVRNISAPFFDNLEPFYHATDLVICRSGAGSLFETLFFDKKCITIPLETKKNNHQVHNALAAKYKYPILITVLRQHEIMKFPDVFFDEIQKKT